MDKRIEHIKNYRIGNHGAYETPGSWYHEDIPYLLNQLFVSQAENEEKQRIINGYERFLAEESDKHTTQMENLKTVEAGILELQAEVEWLNPPNKPLTVDALKTWDGGCMVGVPPLARLGISVLV